MNLHSPQSVEAETELRYLAAAKHHLISAQSSNPNFAIVQDSLLGAYRMTLGIKHVRKDQFYDISMKIDLPLTKVQEKIQKIRKIFKLKGKKVQCFHGKGLISLALPETLNYEHTNNANSLEPTVKIKDGVLYEGTFDKSLLGSSSSSLLVIINKQYGPDEAEKFIDGIQFITNAWLLLTGFSVGLKDCMISGKKEIQEIDDVIQKCYIEAEGIKQTTSHPGIREVRITMALSNAKDIGMKISKNSMDPDNNFISTVKSGSKGCYFNIAQVTGLLGQQNFAGQRVKPSLNNNTRSLVHYPQENLPVEMEYESKGFVKNSFIKGLNPRQFYFHSMCGRESVIDTALNTSTSGYIQRRIVKLTEDIKIQYDNTVRDEVGSIYQFAYGETGIDPKMTVKVGKEQSVCDISSIVNDLNAKYEM